MSKLWAGPRTNKTGTNPTKYVGRSKSGSRRAKRKKRKPKPSKAQTKLALLVKKILVGHPSYRQEVTFPWLKSPKGHPMWVDIVFEEEKLALEYHGPQHMYWPNRFHRTKKVFDAQLERDQLKEKLLKEHGYTVITWPHTKYLSKRAVYARLEDSGYAVKMPPRAKPRPRQKKSRSRKHKLLRMS